MQSFGCGLTRARVTCVAALVVIVAMGATAADVWAEDWSPLWATAPLSQARYRLAGAAAGGKVVFAGGLLPGLTAPSTDAVDIYDSASDTWSTAHLSLRRSALAATAWGGKIYIGGGINSSETGGGPFSDIVDVYDTATDSWSVLQLSHVKEYLAATAANGKVYFGGGTGGGNIVDIFDAATGTRTSNTLSQDREALAAGSAGQKVLFAGGWYPGGTTNRVDVLDQSTNIWSTASLSAARGFMGAASAGGKVFFAGGSVNGGTRLSNVDIYDSNTNTWSTANLSLARAFLTATSVGTKVLFAGGSTSGGSTNRVDIYDTATNTWSISSLPVARSQLAAATLGNKAYFAAGYDASVDIYTLQNYGTITSIKNFMLGDTTTVAGRMQLSAPGSLDLGSFDLTVGSMSGDAPIALGNRKLSTGGDGTSSTYSGPMSGAGGQLTKIGGGTLALAGANSYSGTTTVSGGVLRVTGSLGNTDLLIAAGASLGGTGSIAGRVTIAGGANAATRGVLDLVDGIAATLLLSDANPLDAALTLGGTSAGQTSDLDFEIGGGDSDRIAITAGKVNVRPGGATLHLTPLPGFAPGTYDLLTFPDGQASGLNNLTLDYAGLPAGYDYRLQTTPTAEQLIVAVPEPAAAALGLVIAGVVAFPAGRRERHSKQ